MTQSWLPMRFTLLVSTLCFFHVISFQHNCLPNHRCSSSSLDALQTRRDLVRSVAIITTAVTSSPLPSHSVTTNNDERQKYTQQFPTLFDPIIGKSQRKTIKRQIAPNIWVLEQSLILGPLETPLRSTVIKLSDGTLWVHAPVAPTQEFFDLVEECGDTVSNIVVPTYALEHKIFAKDAVKRWNGANRWTSPGQFSFPFGGASDTLVFGKIVDGVLQQSDTSEGVQPSWSHEIQYETLAAGTFDIGGISTTLYETAFYHVQSKTLIVTDAVAQIPKEPNPLNTPENLLLVSKRSTSDPMPDDTSQNRRIGWEKNALLISYFFPEHEEPDPNKLGVVTWTDGWHDNFQALAGRLIVPPVVRYLLYAQNPQRVEQWVDRVVHRWDFERIVPAHWEAPIMAGRNEFKKAFHFLGDDSIDALPSEDLRRGLKPISDIALKTLASRDE